MPLRSVRISRCVSVARLMARRSATRSGARPPTTGSSMLKYRKVTSAVSVRTPRTPRLARCGAVLPPGMAMSMNSGGMRSITSCWPFRKASHRGCVASMMSISTRSTNGSVRPVSFLAAACPSASSAAGSACHSTLR